MATPQTPPDPPLSEIKADNPTFYAAKWFYDKDCIPARIADYFFSAAKDQTGQLGDRQLSQLLFKCTVDAIRDVGFQRSEIIGWLNESYRDDTKAGPPDAPADLVVAAAEQAIAAPQQPPAWWTFIAGVGSVLEIYPPLDRFGPQISDTEAIAEDWQAIADDLWTVIGSYEFKTSPQDQDGENKTEEQRDGPAQ